VDANILLTLVENDDILVEIQKILMRKEKLMEECGGKFRHKKSFSVVSNEILRNDTISLKAKGLYSLIQSYITLENFTLYKGFLLSKCKEGKKAFDSTWKELKESGYLVQYQMQDPETKQFCWEYELRDSVLEKPYTPNGGMGSDSHNPKRDDMASKIYGKRDDVASRGTINNLKKNTYKKEYLSNHIFTENEVRKQLDCENLNDSVIDTIVSLMVEVLNMDNFSTLRINQQDMPVKAVKARFLKVKHKHIDYIMVAMSDYDSSIKSMRNFMLTTIFNSVTMCDLYFTQRVKGDLV